MCLLFCMSSEIFPSIVSTFPCASVVRGIQQIVQELVLLWNLLFYHGNYMAHNFKLSCQIQRGFMPKTDFGNFRYNH
jgi:hypothetical protein